MGTLNLIQQRSQIKSELSRRIGYTNGLHDIFRFARVVSYLHKIAPASVASLRGTIIEQEESVQGTKYANGVIDVARALGLIHKVGTKLTLSDLGYALYAVQKLNNSDETTKALLLHSVLVFDGDATLNLLDILANPTNSASHGKLLVDRLLRILKIRQDRAEDEIRAKFARDMLIQEFSDSKRRLARAVDMGRKQTQSWSTYREERRLTPEQRLERFYAHTVNPRRGWLIDLGCIQKQGRHQYHVTNAGNRILAFFKEESCYSESVFILPFSIEVSELLGISTSEEKRDLFWRAIAAFFRGPNISVELSPDKYFHQIKRIYPHVKFHLFNEAAIESIYDVLAAQQAICGQYIERRLFADLLESSLAKFPDKLHLLRQRHGLSGYISMKGTVS